MMQIFVLSAGNIEVQIGGTCLVESGCSGSVRSGFDCVCDCFCGVMQMQLNVSWWSGFPIDLDRHFKANGRHSVHKHVLFGKHWPLVDRFIHAKFTDARMLFQEECYTLTAYNSIYWTIMKVLCVLNCVANSNGSVETTCHIATAYIVYNCITNACCALCASVFCAVSCAG